MAKKEISYYDKKKYKTEQGIEKFHDVKYHLLETQTEFEKALEELDSNIYTSIGAEKNRMPYFKQSIKIFGTRDKRLAKFNALCNSFLQSISPELNLDVVEKNIYQKAHNNIHKIVYIPNEKFTCTWIYKDVIYRDEFKLENINKPKSKILVMKSMKAPFELSRTSLVSATIRLDFRKGWKKYIKELKEGINTILVE